MVYGLPNNGNSDNFAWPSRSFTYWQLTKFQLTYSAVRRPSANSRSCWLLVSDFVIRISHLSTNMHRHLTKWKLKWLTDCVDSVNSYGGFTASSWNWSRTRAGNNERYLTRLCYLATAISRLVVQADRGVGTLRKVGLLMADPLLSIPFYPFPLQTTACRGLSSLTLTYMTPDSGLTYTYSFVTVPSCTLNLPPIGSLTYIINSFWDRMLDSWTSSFTTTATRPVRDPKPEKPSHLMRTLHWIYHKSRSTTSASLFTPAQGALTYTNTVVASRLCYAVLLSMLCSSKGLRGSMIARWGITKYFFITVNPFNIKCSVLSW